MENNNVNSELLNFIANCDKYKLNYAICRNPHVTINLSIAEFIKKAYADTYPITEWEQSFLNLEEFYVVQIHIESTYNTYHAFYGETLVDACEDANSFIAENYKPKTPTSKDVLNLLSKFKPTIQFAGYQ